MEEKVTRVSPSDKNPDIYTGQGLIDLQVNGVKGVDFNDPALVKEDVLKAAEYLLSRGVTTFFPTVITNADEHILHLLRTLSQACASFSLVKEVVGGIHLEGPFISGSDGARGAHDLRFVKAPDWELFEKFQQAAGGNIKIITLAPEWEGAGRFIKKCRENNILVSIGHSLADTKQINMAVDRGAVLSTHLGNGVPLMLKRHPNMLWDQLAEDKLFAMIIADGHHLPDSFIKVVMKAKGKRVILVSDATCFAGMPAGEYDTFIGGKILLDSDKKISLRNTPGLLAGAAKDLLEDIQVMINHQLASVGEAWEMASSRVAGMLAANAVDVKPGGEDKVVFKTIGDSIQILQVIKGGKVVLDHSD